MCVCLTSPCAWDSVDAMPLLASAQPAGSKVVTKTFYDTKYTYHDYFLAFSFDVALKYPSKIFLLFTRNHDILRENSAHCSSATG